MIKINKLTEKAVSPEYSNGAYSLTCTDISTQIGKDGKLTLEYKTGLEIEVESGYVAMIFPLDNAFSRSLTLTDSVSTIFHNGKSNEIVARFKVNTDSVPLIYEPGEVFANMLILSVPDVNVEIADYTVQTDTATDTNDANTEGLEASTDQNKVA